MWSLIGLVPGGKNQRNRHAKLGQITEVGKLIIRWVDHEQLRWINSA
jgi:hypothetical protein